MTDGPYVLEPIGWVESPLVDRDMAPLQGDGGLRGAYFVMILRHCQTPDGLDVHPAGELRGDGKWG